MENEENFCELNEFLNKIVNEENNENEKNSSDLIIILNIYTNGFIISCLNSNEKFYSFENNKNKIYFTQISKEKIFPTELISFNKNIYNSKIINKETKLIIKIEDYSKEKYFYVDPDYEKTTINIKLLNGKSLTLEFNLFHTINNIKESLEKLTDLKPNEYTFLKGFPPKTIDFHDNNLSILELDLNNATLIQKKL